MTAQSRIPEVRNRLLIGYHPFEPVGNDYTTNIKRLLSRFGEVVAPPRQRHALLPRLLKRYDLIVVNWPDNQFINASTGLPSPKGILKEMVRLVAYKLCARRVIFTRHNMYPHNTRPAFSRLLKLLVDTYEHFFDLVWVHSGHMEQAARLYIPHPLYNTGRVRPEQLKSNLQDSYVIFGRIVPYKRIEDILEILPPTVSLCVCGSGNDQAYIRKLRSYEGGGNVTISPAFLSEEEAAGVLRSAKGVLVLHGGDDMIVSGSIIHAISAGARIYALSTPFTRWFAENVNRNAIVTAPTLPELLHLMETGTRQLAEADLRAAQQHFRADHVIQKMQETLSRLGLEPVNTMCEEHVAHGLPLRHL